MKDFEKDLIYYPNPDPIEEPRFTLNSVDELEKSEKYSVICNGTERVVIWKFPSIHRLKNWQSDQPVSE